MPAARALPARALPVLAALGLAALSAPAFGQAGPQQPVEQRPETAVQPATGQPEAAPPPQAAAETTAQTSAQTSAQTATPGTEQYQRRIRQAITPDEVRRACAAPNGSLTIGDEIVVCAERDPQQRYRVPSETATRPVDPAQDSPVARANRVMKANDDAPVGPGAERGHGALNPFALGKWLKDLSDKATEEEE